MHEFDISILNFIYHWCHNYLLDKVMPWITSLGSSGFIWIVIAIILLIRKNYRKAGLMTICVLLLTTLLGEGIIKHLAQRPRPFADIPTMKLLIPKPVSYSFPSGHTASSFAAAGILAKEFKRYRIPVILLAALIAFSRMYLYVHYPTDIIGGILLGLVCAKLIQYIFSLVHGEISVKQ